jgi:hypothetical protein
MLEMGGFRHPATPAYRLSVRADSSFFDGITSTVLAHIRQQAEKPGPVHAGFENPGTQKI